MNSACASAQATNAWAAGRLLPSCSRKRGLLGARNPACGPSPNGVGVDAGCRSEFSSIGEHRARLLSEETRDRTEAFVRLLLERVAIQIPLDRALEQMALDYRKRS